ncbi:PH domain-containing protein [Shimazuella kribbensis]|uniref:PH domain-containing protein n=1 Tax=Shimazuella kribbensis TaxID=139808 RepID=UPI0004062DE3|nr:PH domain-containing protein [Shimazuella kribbensis]
MLTYEEIKRLMKTSIGSKFLGRKEVKELPSILWEDEIPKNLIGGNGVLVATDRRLIFIKKGIFSLEVKYFQYDEISYMQEFPGLITGEIVIYSGEDKMKVTNLDNDIFPIFLDRVVNYINKRLESKATNDQIASQDQPEKDEDRTEMVIRQLKELGELKDLGILTEEEFQSEKAKILNTK